MGYMDNLTDLGTVSQTAPAAASSFNPAMAVGGLAASAASAWYGNRMAQKRQHEAFEQSKWLFQNRYQMQVQDMKAAGLNPMLAAGSGAPSPGAPAQAPTQSPDLINAMANATVASAQAAKTRQETINLKAESGNIMETFKVLIRTQEKIGAEIGEIDQRINTGKATEEETKRKAELINIQKELMRVQIQLGLQEKDIKTPEQIASGAEGAAQSATVSRILKPLIDLMGGASGVYRNTK